MKVKVLRDFYDKTEDLKLRKKDEILDVDAKRAEELQNYKVAKAIEEPKKPAEKKG